MEDVGRKQATTKLYFCFCTCVWGLGIQLQDLAGARPSCVVRNNCDKELKERNFTF